MGRLLKLLLLTVIVSVYSHTIPYNFLDADVDFQQQRECENKFREFPSTRMSDLVDWYKQVEDLCLNSERMKQCVQNCIAHEDVCDHQTRVTEGCNQMFSCPQACKIRDFGTDETLCRQFCERDEHDEDRFEESCFATVGGLTFNLCGDCPERKNGLCREDLLKNVNLVVAFIHN